MIARILAFYRRHRDAREAYHSDQRRIARALSIANHPAGKGRN